MPIYEYRCDICGKEYEQYSDFENKPDSLECPCGGVAEPLISRFSVGAKNISRIHRKDMDFDNETVPEINRKQIKMAGESGMFDRVNYPKTKEDMNKNNILAQMNMSKQQMDSYLKKTLIDIHPPDLKFTEKDFK